MNRYFFFFLLLFTSKVISQSFNVEDKYEMIFRKSLFVPKNEFRTSSWGINAAPGFKKIQIRFEIKTLSGKTEIFDPNKFYIVSKSHRIRARPVDFTFHDFLHNYTSFNKLSQEPTDGKYGHLIEYKPEIKDYFLDFKIPNFEDIEIPLNFGDNKKPFIRKTYSEPKKWKSNLIDIYVIIPEDLNIFQLYYGEQNIMEVTPTY